MPKAGQECLALEQLQRLLAVTCRSPATRVSLQKIPAASQHLFSAICCPHNPGLYLI